MRIGIVVNPDAGLEADLLQRKRRSTVADSWCNDRSGPRMQQCMSKFWNSTIKFESYRNPTLRVWMRSNGVIGWVVLIIATPAIASESTADDGKTCLGFISANVDDFRRRWNNRTSSMR